MLLYSLLTAGQVKMELSRVAGGTDLLFQQKNVPVEKYRALIDVCLSLSRHYLHYVPKLMARYTW